MANVIIELRRTGPGGPYGEWVRSDDGIVQNAAFAAAEDEVWENDADSGEISVGGQAYIWRKAREVARG